MPNDDEIIAAYVRENRPEILDALSYRFFWVGYRVKKAIEAFTGGDEELGEDGGEIETKETGGEENDESGK